jgi:GntR family histidine utilization transcriptional repressor
MVVQPVASFRDIKADMLARIRDGVWAPGALLPGEQALAAEYGVARATIHRAMRELAEDGLIERKRRAGSRVRAAPIRHARFEIPMVRREIEAQGGVYRYALMRSERAPAPDWLRARMALAPGVEALHLHCLHLADGQPYQFEDRWISLAATPDAGEADFSAEGPNEWLVRRVPFTTAQIGFFAAPADATQAQALACAPGDALFQAERQTWLDAAAVTLVRLAFRPGYRMTARY